MKNKMILCGALLMISSGCLASYGGLGLEPMLPIPGAPRLEVISDDGDSEQRAARIIAYSNFLDDVKQECLLLKDLAQQGSPDLMRDLLSKVNEGMQACQFIQSFVTQKEGEESLAGIAWNNKNMAMFKYLLQKTSLEKLSTIEHGGYFARQIIEASDCDAMRTLVEAGFDVEFNIVKQNERCSHTKYCECVNFGGPLMIACNKADLPMIKTLLDLKADPNATARCGKTALLGLLTKTPEKSPEAIVKAIDILVDAKADVNQRDQRSLTPFMTAAFNNNEAVLQALAVKGANVHAEIDGFNTHEILAHPEKCYRKCCYSDYSLLLSAPVDPNMFAVLKELGVTDRSCYPWRQKYISDFAPFAVVVVSAASIIAVLSIL